MPTVSVIIPTYGMPQFLNSAIQSVLQQTYQDFELIIVDDNEPCSDARKETERLLMQYSNEQRVTYIKHPRNLNGATARNTGIKAATGEFIAFLDSDDEYAATRLEKCVSVMNGQTDKVAGVYTGCENRRSGKVFSVLSDVKAGNFLVETLATIFEFGTGSNLFIRRTVIKELNGFDESFLRHQDYEFLVRLFEKYDLAAIAESLVIKNDENLNLPNIEKVIDIKKKYLEKYASIIRSLRNTEQQFIYHKQYIQIAELALRSGERSIAKEYYNHARKISGLTIRERIRRVIFSIYKKLK